MASSIMHLAVANEISKVYRPNAGRFNLGNLLPDILAKNKSDKNNTHFRIEKEPYEFSTASYYQYYDYHKFIEQYKTQLDDDLYLGYLSHIITDEIWIQRVYIKYMRDEKRRKRVELQKNYYHDYDILNELIIKKYVTIQSQL
ncbi:hypothetical protein [Fusibacter sp. JL216-2]|uniref:hypothetical protein n=1 Tax=Fusibacter sp. JL216-2 TaxID=3071453 RepID=UPI003D34DAA2